MHTEPPAGCDPTRDAGRSDTLLHELPARPTFPGVSLAFGRIVIIEWLGPNDRRTGLELIRWMEQKKFHTARPGRRIELYQPDTAADLLNVLRTVAEETRRGEKPLPLIHIEAHGYPADGNEKVGYAKVTAAGDLEVLAWEDLTPALREINVASHCNLLLVSAACWGHGAILASCRTNRVPFIACVGFGTTVLARSVLESMKAFYAVALDQTVRHLEEAVEAAQRELLAGEEIAFDLMHGLSYETFEDEFGCFCPTPDRSQ